MEYMKKIGIVIPILNNFRGALEALDSVITSHNWEPIILTQWRRNRPLSAAWNIGINKALNERDCDFALVINDDILFTPGTIDNLVQEFINCPDDVVLLSACNNKGEIDGSYGGPDGVANFVNPGVTGNFAEHPDFSCFIVDHNLHQNIGLFDENFIPAYFEDNDMHRRINLLGYKAGCTASSPYYHYASQTEKSIEFHQMFESNKNYYVRKWGGVPGQETFATPFNNPNLTPRDWE
jgi:GT2 family glycosyltransferase